MRAIILAGGVGSRLAPYTTVLPKPLVPVCGVPILELILLQLREHGFVDITLCTGHMARLIQAYFGDGSHYGLRISYSLETRPLGTAGPLSLVPRGNESILVMNADVLSTLDYTDLFNYHCAHDAALTVGLYNKPVKIDLGVLILDEQNQSVLQYIEKPEYRYQVSMGIYIIDPSVRSFVKRDERLDFPELVARLLAKRRPVLGYPFSGYWVDIGKPADYERACQEIEGHCPRILAEASKLRANNNSVYPLPNQRVA